MSAKPDGSFRLFRFAGIDVYLHWLWILIAYFQIIERPNAYSSLAWNTAEYLGLFGIVLLHEFGHAFGTRQVGGTAETILLWPFGGVAYVKPPPRPGAELWSIAAGPLVNVAIFLVLAGVRALPAARELAFTHPDAYFLLRNVAVINIGLLIFNLLPVYPLDGGQILRSLLWFLVGPVRSLLYASIVGFIGVAGLVALAIYLRSIWTGVIAFMIFSGCRGAFLRARTLTTIPVRKDFACRSCGMAPPVGKLWVCDQCQLLFDTFEHQAQCPQCHKVFPTTDCTSCGKSHAMSDWHLFR